MLSNGKSFATNLNVIVINYDVFMLINYRIIDNSLGHGSIDLKSYNIYKLQTFNWIGSIDNINFIVVKL